MDYSIVDQLQNYRYEYYLFVIEYLFVQFVVRRCANSTDQL